ncbi:MAG: hypothetical protein AB1585_21925 [Thermodesulfobacteriota bacterium]
MRKLFIFLSVGALLGIFLGAAPVQAADSVTGNWDCKIDYGSGTGYPTFVLQQDGEKVAGTYKGALGDSKVTGKITGSDFELSFNSNNIDMTYKGKVEGNRLSGSGDLGPIGKGPFSCTKK